MRECLIFTLLSLWGCIELQALHKSTLNDIKSHATGLSFEENRGQCIDIKNKPCPDILFRTRAKDVTFFLLRDRIVYQFHKTIYPEGYGIKSSLSSSMQDEKLQRNLSSKIATQIHRMDMVLLGINTDAEIIPEEKTFDYVNYYQHHCPNGILNIPLHKRIVYRNIYKGIDWVIYFNREGLKYDFIVHPGANPKDIKFRYEYADNVHLNQNNGNIEINNSLGQLIENKPISYQNGTEITTSFQDRGKYFSYQIDNYDPKVELIIDPLVVAWGTLYHSSAGTHVRNYGGQMAIDKQANVYTAGSAESYTGLAVGGFQIVYGGDIKDGLIVKTDKNGNRVWVTYYGGADIDEILSCALDNSDNLYVGGYTYSSTAIASGGFKNSITTGGNEDGFLAKFNPSGGRLWGTYYGGSGGDQIKSVVMDKNGSIYLGGLTTSSTGIASGGFQNSINGNWDAFLVKFTPACTRIWGTYYGGTGEDIGISCAVSSQNDVYLSGTTNSDTNIASGGFLNTRKSVTVTKDGFLVKFSTNGNRLWATYYGGTDEEVHIRCVTDHSSNVYLYGETLSTTDIAFNGYQNTYCYSFLVRFDNNGVRKWATYVGGGYEDVVKTTRIDRKDFVYIAGLTHSPSNIGYLGFKNIRPSATQDNGFFAKLDSNGTRIWSSYYGGNTGGDVMDCGFDPNNNLHLAITLAPHVDSPEFKSFNKYLPPIANYYYGQGVVKFIECDTFKNDTIIKSICLNDSFLFNGIFRKNNGIYYDSLKTSLGCDSFVTLILNINQYAKDSIVKSICKGQVFQGYASNGIYRDTFVGSKCDSIRILNLNVLKPDTLHIYDTMCELQSYWFNNQNLLTSGLYRDTFTGAIGCDSFVFLHLHVKDTSYYAFSHSTPCDPNASYMFNGLARTQSGIYTAKYLNIQGCDSTAVLNLTIRKPTNIRLQDVSICPNTSYVFDGIPRTTQGYYTRLYTNSQGCASADTLYLKVLNTPARDTVVVQGCSPFTHESQTYTNSTTILDTIKTKITPSCDSIYRTTQLQLKPPATKLPDSSVIVCDSIRINNRLYTSSFSLTDTTRTQGSTQCDSLYQKTNYIVRYTPKTGLKAQDTFPRGSQVTLRPFSTKNYRWSTGEATQTISFKLNEDRQLYLIAWDEEPCRDTAYISLVAEDMAIVGMPSGFSPNGEHAENHTFKPNINGRLESFHMMVFNRWGEKVYETFDTTPLGWNGLYKGEPSPAGLYGYVIEYRTLGTIYTLSGEVMLVR